MGSTELSIQKKKKKKKIMDKKWFSEFAFYSAFKEPGPTPAQRPWEETRYLVYRSTLEIMCQTHQKWASFLDTKVFWNWKGHYRTK